MDMKIQVEDFSLSNLHITSQQLKRASMIQKNNFNSILVS